MYGTNVVVLTLDEQGVRLLVLLPVCLNLKCVLESADYWCSMQYEIVCNLPSCGILLSKSTIRYNDDDGSALLD